MTARHNVVKLPADFREADMKQFTRDQLALARGVGLFGGGDPFVDETAMRGMVRGMLKELAEVHERNAARIVDLALGGAEDAIEALKDLVAEHNSAGLPLTGGDRHLRNHSHRPPRPRSPSGRPPAAELPGKFRHRLPHHHPDAAVSRIEAAAQH